MDGDWSAKDRYSELIGADYVDSSVYTDPEIFEEELKKIFYGNWVFVGHDSEVPNKGDYVTRMIGREPVIMVRGPNGAVNVVSNRCSHRGNLITNRAAGNVRNFTCPYHGWVFSLAGDLLDVPYKSGFGKDHKGLGLDRPARVDSIHGFVFASFNPNVPPLREYLGAAVQAFDRLCALSPVGRISLSAGWVKQKFNTNWKMLPENDTDGYHVNNVHASLVRSMTSHYDSDLAAQEEEVAAVARDLGNGHTELDFAPGYSYPMQWAGAKPESYPDYIETMKQAYGPEKAHEILISGPPHAVIFPNLFLGEVNVLMFQPIDVNTSVHWHAPIKLEGAPESLNKRLVRQGVGGVGPAGFFLADDAAIAERTQVALRGRKAHLDLSRGKEREQRKDQIIESHLTDETTNRAFWHHYRKVMSA
jgi:phenylpropionate dioxygenase-like ring-hydroxylating dioxygenase large terminal subunit